METFRRILHIEDSLADHQLARITLQRSGARFDIVHIDSLQALDLHPAPLAAPAWREQLDAAPWDPAESERVIDEVLYAYQLNTDLFVDLADAKAAAA